MALNAVAQQAHAPNACGACQTPMPANESLQRGWLVGVLVRAQVGAKRVSPARLEICACPAHHAFIVERQLVLVGPPRAPHAVTAKVTPFECSGCYRPWPGAGTRGWAHVQLQRLAGVDERVLELALCPSCSVEVR